MTNKEAIELLRNLIGMVEDTHGNDYNEAFHMAIRSLEAQQWILCSERLPEIGDCGLVTTVSHNVTDFEYWAENKWFLNGGTENGKTEEILAWMPLPQPWKEVEA